jgi:hypothetical protein
MERHGSNAIGSGINNHAQIIILALIKVAEMKTKKNMKNVELSQPERIV